MARLISALFGVHTPPDEWRQAAQIEQLSANWRTTFTRRAESLQIEDWTRRLREP
jgi:hypothetical protein